MNARMYNEGEENFLSLDPTSQYNPSSLLSDPQQLNLYAYARNNPIRYNDPSGNASVVSNVKKFVKNTTAKIIRSGINYVVGKAILSLTKSKSESNVPSVYTPKATIPTVLKTSAPWMDVAKKEIGVMEISGPGNNSRITEYHSTTKLNAKNDETAWCSSFANWTLNQSGIKGTDSAAASSWLIWQGGTQLDKPAYGSIAVVGNPVTHVGFVAGQSDRGGIILLGGNQGPEGSGSVNYSPFNPDSLRYFYPNEHTPNYTLPIQ